MAYSASFNGDKAAGLVAITMHASLHCVLILLQKKARSGRLHTKVMTIIIIQLQQRRESEVSKTPSRAHRQREA
jgi:hypothetical protein